MEKQTMGQPKKGPLADLTDEEFASFIWKLGSLAANSVRAASFARHAYPLSTSKDYLDVYPDDPRPIRLAKEYWIDLVSSTTTEDLAKKWFAASPYDLAAEAGRMLERSLAKGST